MAKLTGALQIKGSISGMSIYKMKGCDELIVRTKGGASKEVIRTHDNFRNLRKQNNEWSGVAQCAGAIRRSVKPLISLADYNFTGQLSALAKSIQKMDTENEPGKRQILLSRYSNLLTGFQLNKEQSFRNTLLSPLSWEINRDEHFATIHIDEINPIFHIKGWIDAGSIFRFVVTLGIVSDYTPDNPKYIPMNDTLPEFTTVTMSAWFSKKEIIGSQTLTLSAPIDKNTIIDNHTSFILGIGIEFATPDLTGEIHPEKRVGCAQILGGG